MTESIYKEYQNKYYNPNDNDKKPGDNDNWKSIQKGFHDIATTQLETSAGLTLGKGTEDETSVTAAELEEIKNPSQLETSGGLTLGKGTEDETSVTAAILSAMKDSAFSTRTVFNVGSFSNGNFQSGFNVLTLSKSEFPAARLSGYKPGKNYVATGVLWAITDNNGAIGVISPLYLTANGDGQLVIEGDITGIFISSGSFYSAVSGVLMIS